MENWKNNNNRLEKEFSFSNFKAALSFVNKVAEIAENLNHHPDIKLYNYKNVCISSTTHDLGNVITKKDEILAKEIDKLILNLAD